MRSTPGTTPTGGKTGYGKRMISSRKARRLMAKGWKAADLHVHTRFSYDVMADPSVDPRFLYQKARDAGMSFVTFTDHDTMAAYDCIGWERPDLVTGVEVKILDRARVGHTIHINVYLLDHRQFREIERIARQAQDLELLLTYLNDNDLPHTYNHPFWFEFGEEPNLTMVPQLFEHFPVVEYNMHRVRRMNRLTLELAEAYGVGMVSATDTHTGQIARAYTLAQGETFREYFENIKAGNFYLVARDLTADMLTSETLAWLDVAFWNSGHDFGMGKRLITGIGRIDQGVRVVLRGELRHRPRLRALLWGLIHLVSFTRIPAFVYVATQRAAGRRVVREMRLAGAIT